MILNNKYSLGFFPTPLQECKNLSKKFINHTIYIKRDDNTGLATGGNKTRKLEYLIQDALDLKCDTIITAGAQQSNHCRQTAAACAQGGLKCHLLLGGTRPETYNGNLLLSTLLGANIHFTGDNRKGEGIDELKNKLQKKGKNPYVIPYGGSNITGALGFVNAAKELKEQLKSMYLKMDYIFFASSSGGMQAGLTLGKHLYELDSTLMPVSIDKEDTLGHSLEEVVLDIINQGKKMMPVKKEFLLDDIELIKGYDKSGYGVITKHEIEAINTLAQQEGILLDPVYSGRAFYGMLDHLQKEKLKIGSNVLFWHTGGIPAIFNYAHLIK